MKKLFHIPVAIKDFSVNLSYFDWFFEKINIKVSLLEGLVQVILSNVSLLGRQIIDAIMVSI